MKPHRTSLEKLRDLERRSARARAAAYTDPELWRDDVYQYGEYRLRNDVNRMAPPEDVVDDRLHRKHVAVADPRSRESGSVTENLILLMFLVGSIYGLYRLTFYLLTQS